MLNMVWMSNALMSSMIAAGLIAGGAGVKRVCRMILRQQQPMAK